MYNFNLLHKKMAADFFGVLAQEMWVLGWWFIDRYRQKADDDNFYCQWEAMLIGLGRAEAAGIGNSHSLGSEPCWLREKG